LDWPRAYSLGLNTISDLGNTACGLYADRFVCSPLHDWMNASFIVLGSTMIAGSGLIYHEFQKSTASRTAFCFMALAGVGTILVGFFPENVSAPLHVLGASLAFLVGNIALVLFGLVLDISRPFRIYTIISGVVTLLALVLFVTNTSLGLGRGGMEHLVSYPQTLWLIVFGIYMSHNHFRNLRSSKRPANTRFS
jgi:hypothetical membrane protein